jgi:hypothetical protein
MGRIIQPVEAGVTRALSVRQPLAERILTGEKRIEYRSWRTHITGRVYLYAPQNLAEVDDPEPGDELLPRGVIVGSVELVRCEESEQWDDEFEWVLRAPHRYATPIKPRGVPQPAFWFPRLRAADGKPKRGGKPK